MRALIPVFVVGSMLVSSKAVIAQDTEVSTDPINDIVVRGQRYLSPGIYVEFLGWRIGVTSDGRAQFVPDGTGTVTTQHTCTEKNAKRETGKDRLATDFKSELAAKPDSDSREYGAVLIYNTAVPNQPTFRLTDITAGQTWAEAGAGAPQVTLSIALQPFDYIGGVIHSHPPIGDPNPTANRLPSDNDWQTYSALQNQFGTRAAPPYAFSHYIVGPDGKMREYRQDAGQPSVATGGIGNGC